MDSQPLWPLGLEADVKAVAGVSVVRKKHGAQRKLLTAVPSNIMWIAVTGSSDMGMHAGASLATAAAQHDSWHIAALDASNAFAAVIVPEWKQVRCSAPPLRARCV